MTQVDAIEPAAAALAARVRDLRKSAGMTQTQLGDRMTKLGAQWGRTTVAKLEAGRRESVSIGELLALALVFDVPPVWLLVDYGARAPVQIATGVESSTEAALLWMTGKRALSNRPGAAWTEAESVLSQLHAAVDSMNALSTLDKIERESFTTEAPTAKQREAHEEMVRRRLESLRWSLNRLAELGGTMPLPSNVVTRAKALGVQLPGFER